MHPARLISTHKFADTQDKQPNIPTRHFLRTNQICISFRFWYFPDLVFPPPDQALHLRYGYILIFQDRIHNNVWLHNSDYFVIPSFFLSKWIPFNLTSMGEKKHSHGSPLR